MMSTSGHKPQSTARGRMNTEDSSYNVGVSDHVYDPQDSPRLTGYISMLICSVICFASCADVSSSFVEPNERTIGIMFGAVSFFISLVLVGVHYVALGRELCVPKGSTLEGACLLLLTCWWIPTGKFSLFRLSSSPLSSILF